MSTDSQLQHAVLEELGWEPSVVAAHIGVSAKAGIVTLTGHVLTFAQKHAAETAARRVQGVTGVAEEIDVVLPVEPRLTDEAIAAAALSQLSWDVLIPKDALQVVVDDGWVTLIGAVEWNYQREAAVTKIRHLAGVTGLSNEVTIRPHLDAESIRDEIIHAMHRSWFFDSNTIAVSTEGGMVTLSGSVHRPHDRQVAAMTAWSAHGVTAVRNDITVT
jgi:osmotically-inducible protein OsmY